MFSQPRSQWTVPDSNMFFQNEENHFSHLSDFKFNNVDLGLAFEELKGNSSPGHDGVPALLLKECRKELTHPLTSFRRASMDMGIIPEELLLVQIYARSPSYVTRSSGQKFKTSEVFLFEDRLCTAACIHSLVESCKRKIRISQYKN